MVAFEAVPILLVLLWFLLKLRRYMNDGSLSKTPRKKNGQHGFWWVNIDGDIRHTINVITWLKDNQRADEDIELRNYGD